MLPSTGYFKGINCPFYDSGFCERPYCHFRHVKKDSQTLNNDEIDNGSILQKLVSAAVQKVLRQTESGSSPSTQTSEIVDPNKKPNNLQTFLPKPTYNPTPIAELNKLNNNTDQDIDDGADQRRKHIPVPYTPRKPASIPVKRPVDGNECNLFTYIPPAKYTPGSTEKAEPDPYTPKGSIESGEKYLPGTEAELQQYTPNDSHVSKKLNYVPSDRTAAKQKILEYKPTKVVKTKTPSVTYKPTPRSLAPCFSSDEDEPDKKKVKISNDLNGLDDLGAEFDILDQILDEEKLEETNKTEVIEKKDNKKNNDITADKTADINRDNARKSESKKESKNSEKKHSEKKHDTKTTKEDRKSKSSDKKSSHKSSHRDKEKDCKDKDKEKNKEKDKSKLEKKSNHSERESKHLKTSSRDSKHSKDSKKKLESSHHKSHKRSKEKKEDKHKKKKDTSVNVSSEINENHDTDRFDIPEEDTYVSESDEEAIALECKRIFEEYVPTEKPVSEVIEEYRPEKPDESDEYIPAKKRISRTVDKNIKVVQKPPAKPDFKANAAQAMANRLAKVREYHASKTAVTPATSVENSTIKNVQMSVTKPITSAPSVGSKIRIAHVPYASTMMSAKGRISTSSTNSQPSSVEPSTSTTIVQTVKKGSQRVAHMPSEKFIDRPGVLEPLGSKIPANIRSTYLNMMIDHCLKIYLTAEDAYARAQHEELTTSKKCSTIPIYKNSAVLTISRLKKELAECNGIKKSGSECNALQKIPQTVTGKVGTTGSWSIENKNRSGIDSKQLCGPKLYGNISKWILSEEQLQENGFPRPHTSGEKGRAIIYKQNKQTPPKGSFRTCCRCKKEYMIDKKGFPANKEECIYHPNNKYRIRGEVRYQCCSQDGSSDGCCIASCHVYEYVDYDNLKGYVKTLPPEYNLDDYGVYSLDCEMCYTTQGLDLTRITVINSSCKVVYETLVRPLHPIIDYNTRYSGITEEQMSQVKTTLLEVQATLLTMFSSKTILIGHSLESDFKALKLIHDTIIDTSVLFPHKMGPPYKRALRNLSSEYLKKIIQNSVDGHDSAEDATVCMELILYKLKDDLKTR